MKLSLSLPLFAVAVTLSACANRDPRFRDDTIYMGGYGGHSREKARAAHDDVSYWDGDGVAGSPLVRISLSEQKAYFYKNSVLVGVSAISSGREGFGTPTGNYRIMQKNRDHKSNLYGDYVDRDGNVIQKDVDVKRDPRPAGAIFDGAKMPFFMRITGGVGMHEGFLPGYPASHGCIRMPGFMAEKFFDSISVGSPVQITH